jgi:isoquinoline 1-oxidoreductase beta subunit
VAAVDLGVAVNPDSVEHQVEGAVVYGLSAVLRGEITLARGAVVQGTFGEYEPLWMDEMPAVEVHVVPSQEAPGGIGEPGLPPLAPAVANALFAATGQRVRRLPVGS